MAINTDSRNQHSCWDLSISRTGPGIVAHPNECRSSTLCSASIDSPLQQPLPSINQNEQQFSDLAWFWPHDFESHEPFIDPESASSIVDSNFFEQFLDDSPRPEDHITDQDELSAYDDVIGPWNAYKNLRSTQAVSPNVPTGNLGESSSYLRLRAQSPLSATKSQNETSQTTVQSPAETDDGQSRLSSCRRSQSMNEIATGDYVSGMQRLCAGLNKICVNSSRCFI